MESYIETSSETEGKRTHDPMSTILHLPSPARRCVFVPGAVIVGAGPSGLAAAACLKRKGVPSVILERSDCIASLWELKTYDRLRLHLPKQFCELPFMPFPAHFPTYPDKAQFLSYLNSYAERFQIEARLRHPVQWARFDPELGFWRLRTPEADFVCRWLVAATGENADPVLPGIPGVDEFGGPVRHTSVYKSGAEFAGKRVLVVGCGNSGMEVCLDLCNHDATPALVVRDKVHVIPREVLGKSTFGLSMWLLKWFPMALVDRFLLIVSRVLLGDTSRVGLDRPAMGPLELKNSSGKTPVLDVGTLAKIKSGDIKVFPGIKRLKRHAVEFVNGRSENFDAIILATGYRSNVPSWLKEEEMFSKDDGLPKRPFPNGWKGDNGLYAVGFTKRGLLGASMDAKRIADDIERCWKAEAKHCMPFTPSTSPSPS